MSTNSNSGNFIVSRNRGIPRGADWAADFAVFTGNVFSAITAPLRRGLQAQSQARARSELLKLADAYERTQPAFAAELRAASTFDARD
ncbi:hypothetical protein BH09PSE5_BH09PSE5_24390 [soil metagenome]